jgi:hypothetical protein
MRAITDKADRLFAMHVPQGHDACATAVDEPEQDLVAATGGARCKKKLPCTQRTQQQQEGSSQRGGSFRRRPAQAAVPRTLMCFYHARFGERAKYCEEGCLWPENFFFS